KRRAQHKYPFLAAVNRRIQEHTLPSTFAVILVKKKPHLHLRRYPLPKEPAVALAEDLVQMLRTQRPLGGSAYPPTLARLIELTRPGADKKLLSKAVPHPLFHGEVLVPLKGQPEAPVALAPDVATLADSPVLLEALLTATRKDGHHGIALADLAKKAVLALRQPVEDAIRRRIGTRSLPP